MRASLTATTAKLQAGCTCMGPNEDCKHVALDTRKSLHQAIEGEVVDTKVFRARFGVWAATGIGIEERKTAGAERNAYETRKASKPTDA